MYAEERQRGILERVPEGHTRQVAPVEEVRVALHTTDAVVRTGLISCLRQDRRLSEIDTAKAGEADVVVVAVETADGSTLKMLRGLRADPTARFLVIVKRQWRIEISIAVDCGVRAVLWHSGFSPKGLALTILTVAQGGGSFPYTLQGDLMEQVQKTQREILAPMGLTRSGTTEREQHVLRMVAEGRELADIAQELSYSERTVKNILYGVMKRFGLRNRAHAVSYAIRTGLI
ncbi:response regulator transcription factor [Streptomyces sp. NPDC048434]|uniref:response regulator transcription factor n=1 Tax=Streptomyces sp. NPDC048434 TaxID=3365549 RepID=UPI003710677B